MPMAPRCVLGPRHLHPGVQTEEDYRRCHAEAIAKGRKKYPNLDWRDPWLTVIRPPVYVTHGMAQIRCATPGCGNCPSVSLEWRLALCWDCGAVYEGVEVPADFALAEAVLVCRPSLATRNWRVAQDGGIDETEAVEDLLVQNRAAGDPVPEWAV